MPSVSDHPSPTLVPTCLQREAVLLAAYAMHSADSRGREHAEPAHPYRGPFQRDRDRILHSSAFRRLSGKMQVFTGDMGDYHRTRLTHTMEVASIARTLGRALGLNEDLIEALALFHDIGHPPFGHAGEDALDECLAAQGGFSHNRFALTLVRELESRTAEYPGLNLTWEVLDGQQFRADKRQAGRAPLLEAQIVDAADSMTYNAHDVDDAMELGLVSLEELAELPLVAELLADRRALLEAPTDELRRKALVHALIDRQVADLLGETLPRLAESGFADAQAPRQAGFRVRHSRRLAAQKGQLERFLYERVYRHQRLMAVRSQAQSRLHQLFERLVRQPFRLPLAFRERAERLGVERAVGDYLASLTDRSCDHEYERLFP